MHLKDIIKENLILEDIGSHGKEDAIGELVDKLLSILEIDNNENIKKILVDREELGSTGIGDNIAIPHAKTKGIKGIVSIFGRSKKGIDFNSLDGKPVHLFCLLLSDEESTNELLAALSQVSRLLMKEDVKEGLLKAKNTKELYQIIYDESSKIN